jgi:hypothetical protein
VYLARILGEKPSQSALFMDPGFRSEQGVTGEMQGIETRASVPPRTQPNSEMTFESWVCLRVSTRCCLVLPKSKFTLHPDRIW